VQVENKSFYNLIRYSSFFVITAGVLVLIGYQFNIVFLRSIFPGFVAMNPLTAIEFILIPAWMLLLNKSENRKKTSKSFSLTILSIAVLSIGIVRMIDIA
jgi:hypothetical protein